MPLSLGDLMEAEQWLTDQNWIVLSFDDGRFARHLEENYFKPNTPKNAEFECMIGPLTIKGIRKMAFWFRIKDTSENRESLRVALAEFYGKRLLGKTQFNAKLKVIQRKIQKTLGKKESR